MTTLAPPDTAEAFVRRLLALDDAEQRSRLIAAHRFPPEVLRAIVLRLVDEAERLITVDPRLMEGVCLNARTLAEQSGDPYLDALALMRYADALRQQGRAGEACDAYDTAAAAFTRLNRPVEAARTRIGWISATASLGQFSEALAAARKARKVLLADGQILRVANLDQSVGIISSRYGKYRAALRAFASAQTLYESLGDDCRLFVAHAHGNRGICAFIPLGRYREAIDELMLARGIFEEMGATRDIATVTQYIGEAQMDLGRYAAALRAFATARAMMPALEMHGVMVSVTLAISECYLRLNRPSEALAALVDSEAELQRTADALDRLAAAARRVAAHLLLGEHASALEVLDGVEQQVGTAGVLHRAELAAQRATVLLESGHPSEALAIGRDAYSLARAAGLRRLAASILITQATALLTLGRAVDAGRVAVRARRLAEALDAAPLLHRAHELIGLVAERRGRPGRAIECYAAAIEQLEREQRSVIFEWRASFAAGRGTAYERLAALQLEGGSPAEALTTAERAKSRALADAIAGYMQPMPRSRRTGPLARLTRRLAAAREEYAATSARLSREDGSPSMSSEKRTPVMARLADLETRIAGIIGQIQIHAANDHIIDPYTAALGDAPPELSAGTALIEFFFSGDDLLRFRVDASGVHGDRLTGAVPEIERLLRVFFVNLDATEQAKPEDRGRLAAQARAVLGRLGSRLLGGLEGLDVYQSLVIVPHGILHYLPFHALHDGERYLIDRFTVSYAPSAALYNVSRQRASRPSNGTPLVLAHSAGGRLPYVAGEGAAVAATLGAPLYQEKAATRGCLRAEGRKAGLIHIAAHGRFRADAPLFSCIELADGPLTTVDVYGLELRAGLVSLSACQTGRGVIGGGDELAGMTRAFLYAGAARLLVTQWRVDDAATAALVTRFYAELAGGSGPATALRAAQLHCIVEGMPQSHHQHPFYWAGFQVVGDDQSLQQRPSGARKDADVWSTVSPTSAPVS